MSYNQSKDTIEDEQSPSVDLDKLQVVAPSLGRRFSGINASMLAVIPEQAKTMNIAALGFHLDGKKLPKISFRKFIQHCWRGNWKIWHARRNIDMLIGLILIKVFRFKLIPVFTSAAQRNHTWITRFYCNQMVAIISPTTAAASFVDRDVTIVPHGINVNRFFPPENREAEWQIKALPGKHGIGVFGRVRPNKGTLEFVEAAIEILSERPEWTAVIIGQTTNEHKAFEQKLRFMIRKAKLEKRILFYGFINDIDEIPKWFRALDIVACTSHVEGFGLTCLEAMASGCSVVATRTGIWPDIITNGVDGILVPVKNGRALATAIKELIDNPQKRDAFSQAARMKIINRYQIQNESVGLQRVYEMILKNRNEEKKQ